MNSTCGLKGKRNIQATSAVSAPINSSSLGERGRQSGRLGPPRRGGGRWRGDGSAGKRSTCPLARASSMSLRRSSGRSGGPAIDYIPRNLGGGTLLALYRAGGPG